MWPRPACRVSAIREVGVGLVGSESSQGSISKLDTGRHPSPSCRHQEAGLNWSQSQSLRDKKCIEFGHLTHGLPNHAPKMKSSNGQLEVTVSSQIN